MIQNIQIRPGITPYKFIIQLHIFLHLENRNNGDKGFHVAICRRNNPLWILYDIQKENEKEKQPSLKTSKKIKIPPILPL